MANPNAGENGKATRFRSGNEAVKNGKKGGKKSGEVRARKSSFREALLSSLTEEKQKEITEAMVVKAKHNIDWLKLMLELTGEAPSQNAPGLMEDDGFVSAMNGETGQVMQDGDDSGLVADPNEI